MKNPATFSHALKKVDHLSDAISCSVAYTCRRHARGQLNLQPRHSETFAWTYLTAIWAHRDTVWGAACWDKSNQVFDNVAGGQCLICFDRQSSSWGHCMWRCSVSYSLLPHYRTIGPAFSIISLQVLSSLCQTCAYKLHVMCMDYSKHTALISDFAQCVSLPQGGIQGLPVCSVASSIMFSFILCAHCWRLGSHWGLHVMSFR